MYRFSAAVATRYSSALMEVVLACFDCNAALFTGFLFVCGYWVEGDYERRKPGCEVSLALDLDASHRDIGNEKKMKSGSDGGGRTGV